MSEEMIEQVIPDLPTKKTLDDIERFGIEFTNGFTAIKNIALQNLNLAKKYVVISEDFDENGNRTGYTFHSNLGLYSNEEKISMLAYYDFLKSINGYITDIENMNNINFYDVMNTRAKIDSLIAVTMSTVLVG